MKTFALILIALFITSTGFSQDAKKENLWERNNILLEKIEIDYLSFKLVELEALKINEVGGTASANVIRVYFIYDENTSEESTDIYIANEDIIGLKSDLEKMIGIASKAVPKQSVEYIYCSRATPQLGVDIEPMGKEWKAKILYGINEFCIGIEHLEGDKEWQPFLIFNHNDKQDVIILTLDDFKSIIKLCDKAMAK